MALSVSRARVKERCGITDTTYDATIDTLISELLPVIEYSIRAEHISDTGNAGLQATLNLAALEIVSAEFVAQLYREPGATDEVRVGELTLTPFLPRQIDDVSGLKAQAHSRLAPYLKPESSAPPASTSRVAGAGRNPFRDPEP